MQLYFLSVIIIIAFYLYWTPRVLGAKPVGFDDSLFQTKVDACQVIPFKFDRNRTRTF